MTLYLTIPYSNYPGIGFSHVLSKHTCIGKLAFTTTETVVTILMLHKDKRGGVLYLVKICKFVY